MNFGLIRMRSPVKLESCTLVALSCVDEVKLILILKSMKRRESALVSLPIGFKKFPGAKAGIWSTDVPMRSCLNILFIFGKVKALLHATVNDVREKSTRRSRVYGDSRLLEVQVIRCS